MHDPDETPEHALGVDHTGADSLTGRYRIARELRRGERGIVLQAWDEQLERPLALKYALTKCEFKPNGETPERVTRRLQRFRNEARITASLDHPGIVPLFDAGVDAEARAYFTMRLVEGQDFAEVLDRVHANDADWPLTRALNALLRACEAVAYAHERDIVHRDLKPTNVKVGHFGEAYVMDWGLARRSGSPDPSRPIPGSGVSEAEPRTLDGDIIDAPAYMPPEQARGELEDIGPTSDVYALGAVLFHLLTGLPPHWEEGASNTPREVLARVLRSPVATIQEVAPYHPLELQAICDRATQHEPNKRYPSAVELARDLRGYLENRVERGRRTGALDELRKWTVRHRGVAAGAAAAILILIVSLFASGQVKARENDELVELLEQQRQLAESLGVSLELPDPTSNETATTRRTGLEGTLDETQTLAVDGSE